MPGAFELALLSRLACVERCGGADGGKLPTWYWQLRQK